jgi:hypothetical protein
MRREEEVSVVVVVVGVHAVIVCGWAAQRMASIDWNDRSVQCDDAYTAPVPPSLLGCSLTSAPSSDPLSPCS